MRRKLVRAKSLALGESVGRTKPCNHGNCACCDMIAPTDEFSCNGKKIRPAGGTCSSNNLIYCVVCTICNKPYVGRTVQQLNYRISGHRGGYTKVIETISNDNFISSDLDKLIKNDSNSESYTLGMHLYKDHNCTDRTDFNKIYQVFILDQCSPSVMDVKEHKYIQILRALHPTGLNKSNPFNIPLLN